MPHLFLPLKPISVFQRKDLQGMMQFLFPRTSHGLRTRQCVCVYKEGGLFVRGAPELTGLPPPPVWLSVVAGSQPAAREA